MRTHWLTRYLDFTPPGICFAEGDGAGDAGGGAPATPSPSGSGAGGAPATPATPATPAGPNWTEFVSSLGELNNSLGGKLDTLVNEVRTVATPAPAAPEPVDLEAMSRPELVAHIVGTISEAVRAQISEALNPVTEQITSLQLRTTTNDAIADRDRLKGEHKDFDEWRQDMIDLAKSSSVYQQLTLPDLFGLVRSRNPAKVAALAAKYNPPAPKPAPRWGGLTPTGGAANGTPVLSSRDAGIEAYREVQAKYPGVLAALES